MSSTAVDRPPVNASYFCHIVESWQPPAPPATNRTINVYSNAPYIVLTLDSQPVGDDYYVSDEPRLCGGSTAPRLLSSVSVSCCGGAGCVHIGVVARL